MEIVLLGVIIVTFLFFVFLVCCFVLSAKELEEEMLDKVNNLGIGPGGLGGRVTAIGLNIETYATHIAGLPVAVNICCHVNRHITRVL